MLIIAWGLVRLHVRDGTRKRHKILRDDPIIDRLRFLFEELGECFGQFFFLGDCGEMPF